MKTCRRSFKLHFKAMALIVLLSVIFFDIDMAKQLAVNKKTDANNTIYEAVIEMMKDGQTDF